MAKLIDVTMETISPALDGYTTQEIGNSIVIKLDEDRRITIRLDTCGIHEEYAMVLCILTSKTHGELNRAGAKFKDLIGVGKNVSADYNGGYKWYGASASDFSKIRKFVRDYIETWE